jgi:hypothetical protein
MSELVTVTADQMHQFFAGFRELSSQEANRARDCFEHRIDALVAYGVSE